MAVQKKPKRSKLPKNLKKLIPEPLLVFRAVTVVESCNQQPKPSFKLRIFKSGQQPKQ
jgi:hypothetical protein